MNQTHKQCYHYLCDKDGDTKDHVPPKVFFPSKSDGETNYRDPLVTVRACKNHNKSYEKDDEYVAYAMHMHYKNNQSAKNNFYGKVMRAFNRNQNLEETIIQNPQDVMWTRPDSGRLESTLAFTLDQPRVDRVMCRIAAALYFKVTGRKVSAEPAYYFVYSPDTFGGDPLESELEDNISTIAGFTPLELWHKDIFSCDYLIDPVNQNRYLFRFTFYGNYRYRVVSKRATPMPSLTQ